MLALVCTIFAASVHPTTVRGRKLSFSPKKRLLATESPTDDWYFVRFHDAPDHKLLQEQGIQVTSKNVILSRTYGLYLTTPQVMALSKIADLQKIEGRHKLIATDIPKNEIVQFFVETTSDFVPPEDTKLKWQKLSADMFAVNFTDYEQALSELLSNSKVFAVTGSRASQSRNSMSAGFLQYHDVNYSPKVDTSAKVLYYPRVLGDQGLDGRGITVALLDTYLDVNLTWFYDPRYPQGPNETLNMNHRKVVYYKRVSNMSAGEKFVAHGTHVATTLAGKAYDGGDPTAHLYNGMAPGVKLAWADQRNVGPADLGKELLEIMNKFNIHLSSCSWGDQEFSATSYNYFDKIAYENPDKLIIFACANSGQEFGFNGYNSLSSPESCKNILAVGALMQVPVSNASQALIEPDVFIIVHAVVNYPSTRARRLEWSAPVDTYFTETDSIVWRQTKALNATRYDSTCVFARNMTTIAKAINFTHIAPACCLVYEDDGWKPTEEMYISFPVFVMENPQEWESTFQLPQQVIQIRQQYRIADRGADIGIASFSSRGPSIHGLLKPEVVGPGSGIQSGAAMPDSERGATLLAFMSGCSMSTPSIAGCLAILEQYFTQGHYRNTSLIPSATLLKTVLISVCDRPVKPINGTPNFYMDGSVDALYGHGWPNLAANLPLPTNKRKMIVEDNLEISGKSHYVGEFRVTDCTDSLRVTMSYLDEPVSADSPIALYNNLDLVLETPDGYVIMGNSRADDSEERYSTTERVVISPGSPWAGSAYVPGVYKIHVISQVRSATPVKYSLCVIGGVVEGILNMERTTKCVSQALFGTCNNETGQWECKSFMSGVFCNKQYNLMATITDEGGYNLMVVKEYGINWIQFSPPTKPWANISLFVVGASGYGMITYFVKGKVISTDPWFYETVNTGPGPHQYVIVNDGTMNENHTFTVMVKNNGPVETQYTSWYRINYTAEYPGGDGGKKEKSKKSASTGLAIFFGIFFVLAAAAAIVIGILYWRKVKKYEKSSSMRENLLQVV